MTAFLGPFAPFIAGALAVLLLSNLWFINLWSDARDALITYKAEVSLAQSQIEADVQRRLRLSDNVTADTRLALDTALARLRSRPSVRVLPANCNSGTGATLSVTPASTLKTPAADSVDTGIVLTAEECAEKLGDGIEDAVRFAWLQDWVVQQHDVKP